MFNIITNEQDTYDFVYSFIKFNPAQMIQADIRSQLLDAKYLYRNVIKVYS